MKSMRTVMPFVSRSAWTTAMRRWNGSSDVLLRHLLAEG